jgi:hypothetical protein
MDDFSAFTNGERALFEALNRYGVRFMLVGLSAAVLQGANTAMRDIELWFEDTSDARIDQAVRAAGGIWVPGSLGMRPPKQELPKDLAVIPALEEALAAAAEEGLGEPEPRSRSVV